MIRPSCIEDIAQLYAVRGGLHYGEGVTQIEHALQCAAIAREQGGTPSLIVAALLHDIGHLFENEDDVAGSCFDDRHEAAGANALSGFFGEAVCKPIALHVAAKRYLCFREPRYFEALSPASKISLELQGGIFDVVKVAAFEKLPYWQEAVMLRRMDDVGKRKEMSGLSFGDFVPLMRELLKDGTAT